jgi:hypothetical protein
VRDGLFRCFDDGDDNDDYQNRDGDPDDDAHLTRGKFKVGLVEIVAHLHIFPPLPRHGVS